MKKPRTFHLWLNAYRFNAGQPVFHGHDAKGCGGCLQPYIVAVEKPRAAPKRKKAEK